MLKITINSNTTGSVRTEQLNGRDHLVTEMIPIVGDSVMKGGFYPDEEVSASFNSLDGLLAPSGHPKVNGYNVSAYHPLAVNANNVGGFILNPSKSGKVVTCEFWLDTTVAVNSKDGKELMRRINAKEKVGVSTGLILDEFATNGESPDGTPYTWVGKNYRFDHVALLLNEVAAGDASGTELQLNQQGEGRTKDVFIVNRADISTNELGIDSLKGQLHELLKEQEGVTNYVWILDCFPDSQQVIYEVESKDAPLTITIYKQGYEVDDNDIVTLHPEIQDKREVIKKIEFIEPTTNSERDNAMADKKTPDVTPTADTDKTVVNEVTFEDAVKVVEAKGFVINKKEDAPRIERLLTMEPQINALLEKEDARLKVLRDKIVANTDLTEEDVKSMGEETLLNLQKSFAPAPTTDNSLRGGFSPTALNQENGEGDHRESYTPEYDKETV